MVYMTQFPDVGSGTNQTIDKDTQGPFSQKDLLVWI